MSREAHGAQCSFPCSANEVCSTLLADAEPFRFNRGDTLWTEGEPADHLMLVCSGHLKLTRSWLGEREPILGLVHRGELLGEEAAIDKSTRSVSAVALSRGKGVRLYQEDLRVALRREPRHYAVLLKQAIARAEAFASRLEELGDGAVEHRLARVMLRIGQEVGLPDARGVFLPMRLTRGDLSDLVGCRVETTIRVMTRWRRQGLVDTLREGLVIRDEAALRAVG